MRSFIRGFGLAGLVALCALMAGLDLSAASASAAITHPYLKSITGCTSAMQQPWGLAFDGSGNLFVADAEAQEIYKFNSSGSCLTEFKSSKWELPYVRSVSVNDTTGNVYVADSGTSPESTYVFEPEGGTYKELQRFPDPVGNYMYVAVNNSTSAHAGEVYVSEAQATVSVFKPNAEGKLESSAKKELAAPLGGFGLVSEFVPDVEEGSGGLAIDPATGRIYIPEPGPAGESHELVSVYSSSDVLEKQFSGSETPAKSFVPVGVAIDDSTGNIYVVDGAHKVVDEFTGEGKYLAQIKGISGTEPFVKPHAVAVQNAVGGTQGDVYVSDNGGKVDVFGPDTIPTGFTLMVAKKGAGGGTVTSTPAGISCGATCEASFEENETVTLKETPTGSSKLVKWVGCESNPSASECVVTMATEKTVEIEYSLPKFPVEVTSVTGEGEVTGETIKCTHAGGVCSEEQEQDGTVTLSETTPSGWKLKQWSLTGSSCAGGDTSSTCKFTMPEGAVKVAVEFEETHAFLLTVSVTGEGTVTSTPAGITACGPSSGKCSEELEGTVTLAATAKTGYVFAGWIGCKKATTGTCTIELEAPSEVTAVFLKEGATGAQGPTGIPGAEGQEGKTGKEGPGGAEGPQGPTGKLGPQGPTGPSGATGPAGPAGKEGPAGKVQLVMCKTVKQGKKKVQKCTSKTVSGTVKFTASSMSGTHATLSRRGAVYAAGTASTIQGRLSLRLLAVRGLRAGRYTLTLTGGAGAHAWIHTEAFVLR